MLPEFIRVADCEHRDGAYDVFNDADLRGMFDVALYPCGLLTVVVATEGVFGSAGVTTDTDLTDLIQKVLRQLHAGPSARRAA